MTSQTAKMNDLLICLQTYPGDHDTALLLARLIADLEATRPLNAIRPQIGFMVSGRRDSDRVMLDRIAEEFRRIPGCPVHIFLSERRSTSYPMAANDLWQATMQEIASGTKAGRFSYSGVLTFEPDCVPLRKDWIDVLVKEWRITLDAGLKVMGHHGVNRGVVTHINGNLVATPRLASEHPELTGSPGQTPWDCHHGQLLLSIGRDTFAIFQCGRIPEAKTTQYVDIRKHGERPAIWHGIKDPRVFAIAREML